jgi:hypothetical protein
MNSKVRIGNTLLASLLACGLGACTSSEKSEEQTPDAGVATSTLDGVLCPLPANPLITDFTPAAGATPDTTQVHFGDSTTLGGGEFVYPAALKSDVTQGNWHLTGTIGDYSGFGFFWDNCTRVDASAYKGISFKISGSVQGNQITMGIGTVGNAITAEWLIAHGDTAVKADAPGRCVPPATAANKYAQTTCHDAEKTIDVSATATTVNVLWGDFSKGAPTATVDPKNIVTVYWFLPWTGTGPTYEADLTIDDISFIP